MLYPLSYGRPAESAASMLQAANGLAQNERHPVKRVSLAPAGSD